MADVFISYHVASAAELVRQISTSLESSGVSCWYSEENVPSGKYFAEIVPREIDACRIFLLVLDEGANKSFHVKTEVELATKRKARGENIEIIPFYLLKGSMSEPLRYNLAQSQRVDGRTPPIEARIRELTDQIKQRLGIEESEPVPPPQHPKKGLWKRVAAVLLVALILCAAAFYAARRGLPAKSAIEQGMEAYQLSQYQTAVKHFTTAAEQGNADAMFFLGQCYQEGNGVPQHEEKAQMWYAEAVKAYETAAENNDPNAMYRLGVCYDEGLGIREDWNTSAAWYEQAIEAYKTAAAEGNVVAMIQLGRIHEYFGDDTTARIWYQKAAETGSVEGMYELGRIFWTEYQNKESGMKWLTQAADAGNTDAMKLLATAYQNGDYGIEANTETALEWLDKAASAGDVGAMRAYYYICRNIDRAADTTAVKWLETGAKLGDSESASLLGDHYFFAYDGSLLRDYKKAAQWYEVAAELGNQYAIGRIAICCRFGFGMQKDVQQAWKWEAMMDTPPTFLSQETVHSEDIDEAHEEAWNYVLAIGAMAIYEDGFTRQEATLTRQAGTKIWANLKLGPQQAKALPTDVSPFLDVMEGTEWNGYITWCTENGLISGYSDGLFRPTGALSDYAFQKALLSLFGYGEASEYTGDKWKSTVSNASSSFGLGEPTGEGITRGDAAVMVLAITRDCAKPD